MPTSNPKPSFRKKQLNDYARYSAIGFQMAAIILLFTWGGSKIDDYLGLKVPVFTLVLSLVSVAVSIWFLIREFSNKKD